MNANLRHDMHHSSRLPVIRYAVLLFLLTAVVVVAVAVTLDRNAQHATWQQNTTALAGAARVSSSAFGTLRSNLRVQASQLATSLTLQRAVITHDQAQLRRIAALHHVRITIKGETIGALLPGPHVASTATITDQARVLATITAALPLGPAVLTLLRQATPLPDHSALLFVRRGRVIAGGPLGTVATVRDGRLTLGKTSFAAESAPLPLAGLSVLAVEPVSAVEIGFERYRRLIVLASLLTLALMAGVAARLARPLAHVVGEVSRLSRQAQTDSLTGLANRGGLSDRIEIVLARAREDGTSASFVIADVDNFKGINDGWGHQCGDEVIQAVGRAIAGCVREVDLAARYGGDEFAIVLPGARLRDAKRTADRVRRAVGAIEVPGAPDLRVTMSFGVAEFPMYSVSESLMAAADAALYQAKWGGKNQVATAMVQRQRQPSAAEAAPAPVEAT